MCTRRAPALLHARAESSHLTRIVWWLKGSARRAPETAAALRAVSLCLCVRDVAVSGSSTWRVGGVSWSSMASTARVVLKLASFGSHHGRRCCSYSDVARGWTAAAHVRSPLTVARCSASARRCDSCEATCAPLTRMGRGSRACGTLAHGRGPELRRAHLSALWTFVATYGKSQPAAKLIKQRKQIVCSKLCSLRLNT